MCEIGDTEHKYCLKKQTSKQKTTANEYDKTGSISDLLESDNRSDNRDNRSGSDAGKCITGHTVEVAQPHS